MLSRLHEPAEKYIEADILDFLTVQKVLCWKNDIKWFFDEKTQSYKRNHSNFIRRWIPDIMFVIEWRIIAVEVKKPSEMAFFDKSIQELKDQFAIAMRSNLTKSTLKKYNHAIEQRAFLDEIIEAGWVGFFASSLEQFIKRMKQNWFKII